MNTQLILELTNHNIYYVKTNIINYYIAVPKYYNETNICLELKNKMSNFDMETNDMAFVMENIKNAYSYVDNYNITLVIPVLKEEHIKVLEKIDSSKYNNIDNILGNVINLAFNTLTQCNIKINSQIILINNDKYKTFINWFLTKYQNRVICKNLLDLILLYNANATIYKKLETPGINFVVGSYTAEVDAPKLEPVKEESPVPQKQLQVSYGFASYWILVAVTILVAGIVAAIAYFL